MSTNISMPNTIFIKKTEKKNIISNENSTSESEIKLLKSNIFKSIPKNSFKVQQKNEKFKKMREYRWRFFRIYNSKTDFKDFVEISYLDPNNKRKCINNNHDWIDKEIDQLYEKFIVDEFYFYSVI
jgi:hypothetical protein